ncbi:MAG: site-2 protease family protein [Acidobacteriota bacterium]|nr:site-2 protease family protein [Acidobacteriota bacterium]
MKRIFILGSNLAIAVFSLWVHDRVRVWMAGRCGDTEAASRQRSADNPFARIDWIGSVLLPLYLLFRGLPILGWVKPLELDLEKLRHPRRDGLLIAASGPVANLLLALAGIGAFLGLNAAGLLKSPFLLQVLPFFCLANVCLGVFNLLPIPPLAGGVAAELFLYDDALSAYEDIKPFGFILLLVGAFFNFFNFITMPLTWLVNSLLGF